MPITADVIKQSEALADLPEDKVEAIVKLATNVFTEDIATHTGVTKRRWEEDIKTLYGADKPDPKMPAHEFLKTAWTERENKFKEELAAARQNPAGADELKTRYEAEIERLKGEMKDATLRGSELLRKDIEEYKQRLKDLEDQREGIKKDASKKVQELEQKYLQSEKEKLHLKVGFEKSAALVGIELDPHIPESARETVIEARWAQLLNRLTPEQVEVDGKVITQWRDKDGNLARNPNNNREPYTTKELLLEELKDVTKKGRQQAGTGSGAGSGGGSSTLDLQAAKTQVEADNAIKQHLIARGLAVGTSKYQTEFDKIRDENKDLFTGEKRLPLQ